MNVLIIDENPAEADALVQFFEDNGHYAEWSACVDAAKARARLHQFEVVMTDLVFPGHSAGKTLDMVSKMHNSPRLLILTSLRRDDPALELLPAGTRVLYSPCTAEEILLSAEHEAGLHRLVIKVAEEQEQDATHAKAGYRDSHSDHGGGQAPPG